MAGAVPRPMTVAEFQAYDDGTDTRYELVDGVMVPRSPADEPHMWILANVYGAVAKRLRPGLRAYMGGGVWRYPHDDTWRQPDLFVSGERDGFSRTPRMVIEIVSPASEGDDRTRKLDFYRRFESVEAILFVWQDTPRVELQERAEGAWLLRNVIGGGDVPITALGLELPLAEIYA